MLPCTTERGNWCAVLCFQVFSARGSDRNGRYRSGARGPSDAARVFVKTVKTEAVVAVPAFPSTITSIPMPKGWQLTVLSPDPISGRGPDRVVVTVGAGGLISEHNLLLFGTAMPAPRWKCAGRAIRPAR